MKPSARSAKNFVRPPRLCACVFVAIIREDTGLSCISKAELWRNGKRIGDKVKIIMHENDLSFIDIHSYYDLKIANKLLK